MKEHFKASILAVCVLLLIGMHELSFPQVRLPHLVSDGMILQRDTNDRIWGWAASNERITIQFKDSTYKTVADFAGRWSVLLAPSPAGGPFAMVIRGSNEITLRNILVGDVWVCSGQSNMELTMRGVRPKYGMEIANSANEYIRQFYVPQKYNFNGPLDDLESGSWISANPQSVLNFSAVAYFFGKELFEKYRVPIGLINTSLGGSPAESWMSEQALKLFPVYLEEAERFKDSTLIQTIEDGDNKRIHAWYQLLAQSDSG
jgi:sialate O-acetylesterase